MIIYESSRSWILSIMSFLLCLIVLLILCIYALFEWTFSTLPLILTFTLGGIRLSISNQMKANAKLAQPTNKHSVLR